LPTSWPRRRVVGVASRNSSHGAPSRSWYKPSADAAPATYQQIGTALGLSPQYVRNVIQTVDFQLRNSLGLDVERVDVRVSGLRHEAADGNPEL